MKRFVAGVAVAYLCVGCGGGSIRNKSVSSVGNLFTFTADLKGAYSGSDDETWSPTTQQAWVTWDGTAVTAGQIGLELFDANSASVLSETVTASQVPAGQASAVGAAGNWRVLVTFDGATGSLALKIQGSTGGAP